MANYHSRHTGTEVDDAIDLAHSHSNKATLDAITSAEVSYWNGKQDALVAGTNITIDPDTNVISATGGSGSSTWGSITGTLADQTDLKSALDAKATPADITTAINALNKSGSPSTNQYISIVRQSAGIIECQKATLPMHTAGNGIQVSSGTVSAKLGSGLSFDANGAIQATGGGGGAAWGSITGTLSSQTDLQSALDAKANSSAIPTKVSDLTNDSGFITSSALSGYQTAIPDVASGATTGKFVSAVSQSNGQISVTYKGMDNLSNSNQDLADDEYLIRGTNTGYIQKSRFSILWTWITTKLSSVFGVSTSAYPITGGASKLKIVKVASLPASPDANTIYLVSE